jgi:hypothetical protein
MSINDFILIAGCVAAGYWVVSSVLEPGADGIEETRKHRPPGNRPGPASTPAQREEPLRDWYLVLDVSTDASPAEIREAAKRRLAQAESAGDMDAVRRIAKAVEQGLKQRPKRPVRPRGPRG